MCRSSSDEQIRDIDKGSRHHQPGGNQMFTNESVKAEVSYRRERLTRDYRRSTRKPGTRRSIVHLFNKFV
jgi:hypothetical protein